MNEQELKELKDQVMYAGIQDNIDKKLSALIKKGASQSKIVLDEKTMDNGDKVVVDLRFGKSEKNGKHYLNNFHVKMTKPNDDVIEQTFYRNFGASVTFKEAINLMNGRAVYKEGLVNQEGEKHNAWLQIDFTKADKHGNYKYHKFHDNYGFDLESKLVERGYKQMNVQSEDNYFVNSIKKGDLVLGTRQEAGSEVKEYVEANPRFKTINVYDLNLKRLSLAEKDSQQNKQGQGKDNKQNQRTRNSKTTNKSAATTNKAGRARGRAARA